MIVFDESWENWVATNLEAGCDKHLMYNDMLKAGFEHDFVTSKLGEDAAEPSPERKHFLYTPGSEKYELINANVRVINDFISDGECFGLGLLLKQENQDEISDSFLIRDIDKRLCKFLGVRSQASSAIEADVRLNNEDSFDNSHYYAPHPELGECSLLALIFLNKSLSGGEVQSAEGGLSIKPERGALVLWEMESGTEHELAEKINLTKIRGGYQAVIFKKYYNHHASLRKIPNEYIPAYTQSGFIKAKIPENLMRKILAFYYSNIDNTTSEIDMTHIRGVNNEISSELIELPDELKATIHKTLQPLTEAWIGNYLEPTFVFGIRRYLDSSVLKCHHDRNTTHVASAILNIDQKVRKPWPLYIEDHHYRGHEIYLNPGEMIFYEGCKLKHGRPKPLEGDFFCNLFVHYSIK